MGAADTYVLLRAFADELVRCGMRIACTSPGSRCAPLVLSLAREPRLSCYSHIDERCAGFFALGAAKASGLPVAVTCTSGTAAAELLPAAIEAHEARVPLLLLTADRPPELRENGAGQAIDQLKLYGDAAKWFFEVDSFDKSSPARLRWMRTLACRAYWTAIDGRPGVVHLNFPLREPLVTDEPLPADDTGRSDGSPHVRRTPTPSSAPYAGPGGTTQTGTATESQYGIQAETGAAARLATLIDSVRRGVVVVGRHERWSIRGCWPNGGCERERVSPRLGSERLPDRSSLGEAAARFCEAAGWPLLADPMSGARRGTTAIAHYDALLRDERFARVHRPDLVLRIGDLPVSKPLRTWLADLEDTVPQVAFDPEGAWQDPASVLSESVALEPAAALAGLAERLTASGERVAADPDWLDAWRNADELAAGAILGIFDGAERMDEPSVAAELGVLLPERATLFVASSMPVRDIETFWPVRSDPPRVLCNRGANGIDGTISSAFGAAAVAESAMETPTGAGTSAGAGGPVVLLIGDIAFAHDLGGLLAAGRLDLPLTIVLLDNGGGGIFDFLPVARARIAAERDVYSRHIATPTGLDFQQAAELYGLAYERAETVIGLREALERAFEPDSASTLIHIRTDRAANVEVHGRVWSAVSKALHAA